MIILTIIMSIIIINLIIIIIEEGYSSLKNPRPKRAGKRGGELWWAL